MDNEIVEDIEQQESKVSEITDEEMKARGYVEIDLKEKLHKISLGGLFMPAIWGPFHGFWVTVLFYPLWIWTDSLIRNAIIRGGFAIALAVIMVVVTIVFTILFAIKSNEPAYLRVADKVKLDTYIKRERIWAIAMFIVLVLGLGFATYYNLTVFLPQHGIYLI